MRRWIRTRKTDSRISDTCSDTMSEIDICFISPRIYRYLQPDGQKAAGGAQRQQYFIGRELSNRGHRVSYIVRDYDQPRYERIDGLHVWRGCPSGVSPLHLAPVRIWRLYKAMRAADAETYYVRGAPPLAAPVYYLTRILSKRFVFCLANDRDVDPEGIDRLPEPLARAYIRALGGAEEIITQTERQRKAVNELVDREATVISNGYHPVSTDEIRSHSNRNTVLWIGTDDIDQKHPERFISLAESLPSIDFTMICRQIVNPDVHRDLEQSAAELDNMTFIESVSPSEIHRFYNKSYALVNTSDYEGFPNTFLEAWRYETPVVSLHFSLDGLLSSRDVGYLSQDPESLKRDVKELVSNPSRRKEIGKNGRELLESEFTINDAVSKYEELLYK